MIAVATFVTAGATVALRAEVRLTTFAVALPRA